MLNSSSLSTSAVTNLLNQARTAPSSLANPDGGMAAEAYRRLRLSEKLMSDFYFDIHKDRLRDRVVSLQNEAKQCFARGDHAEMQIWMKKTNDELLKQYIAATSVAPNDTCSSLQLKIALGDTMYGLCRQSRVENFDVEFPSAVHQKRKNDVMEGMVAKLTAIKEKCEKYEAVYYPDRREGEMLTEAQAGEIFKLCAPFKARPRRVPNVKTPWYPGPPLWEHDELFVDKFRQKVGRGFDFVTENMFRQRKMDINHRFYSFQYASTGAYNIIEEFGTPVSFEDLNRGVLPGARNEHVAADIVLSYAHHMAIHVRAGCMVELLQQELCQDPQEVMTATEFKAKVKVVFPEVVVGKCDYCKKPAVGECLCGEVYCSKECQAAHWTNHKELCNTVIDNCCFLLSMTPLGWGQNAIQEEDYLRW